MSCKMAAYGSNATQCAITMRHFSTTHSLIAALCDQHRDWYMGQGSQAGSMTADEAAAYWQAYKPSDAELCDISVGGTPFELEWLCLDAAEKAAKVLEKVKEDSVREASG